MSGIVLGQITSAMSSLQSRELGSYFTNVKPISEFFDIKRISRPENFGVVQSRMNYNLAQFSGNYVVVFMLLAFYSIITNLTLLFAILFFAGGLWALKRIESTENKYGLRDSTVSQMYTFIYIGGIFLILYASPITTMLWLVGASGVTILGHASLLDKPIDEAFAGDAV